MGTLDEHTKAWMAGLFDGDGFVGCYHANGKYPAYHTQAGIVNIDGEALKIFKKEYGGCLRTRRTTSKNHNIRSDWRVSGQLMKRFLKDIRPYSVIKKARIELALEFLGGIGDNGSNGKGRGRRNLSEKEVKRRNEIIKKMKALQTHKVALA